MARKKNLSDLEFFRQYAERRWSKETVAITRQRAKGARFVLVVHDIWGSIRIFDISDSNGIALISLAILKQYKELMYIAEPPHDPVQPAFSKEAVCAMSLDDTINRGVKSSLAAAWVYYENCLKTAANARDEIERVDSAITTSDGILAYAILKELSDNRLEGMFSMVFERLLTAEEIS